MLTMTTKNFHTVTDLERSRTYTFRVVALGALGFGPVSDIAIATAA